MGASVNMMMMMMLVVMMMTIGFVLGKPYQIPLQGSVNGLRTLVLLDSTSQMHSHSLFFDMLRRHGHELSFRAAASPDVQLRRYGVDLYDNLIFFAPTIDTMNTITHADIVAFVDRGGNAIIGIDTGVCDELRGTLNALGIAVIENNAPIIDHAYFASGMDERRDHSVFASTSWNMYPSYLGDWLANQSSSTASGVLYSGVGLSYNKNSIFSTTLLQANPSSFIQVSNGDEVAARGSDIALAVAVQARNNARLIVSGSLRMLSNSFLRARKNGELFNNEAFVEAAIGWVFGERSVLRFRDIVHHKSDLTPPDVILHEKVRPDLPISLYPDPELTRNSLVYRIKDEIVFSFVVEELQKSSCHMKADSCANVVEGSDSQQCSAGISLATKSEVNSGCMEWKPFCAADMQLEFVMLDAYVRKNMTCDRSRGRMTATFTAPDNYGVFKFRVVYRRPGFSVLHSETQVSIRPFKHNEYERFIPAATPYYTSAVSAVVVFFIFSVLFLFSA